MDDAGDGGEEASPLDFGSGVVADFVAADDDGGVAAPGQSPVGLASGRAGLGPPSRPKS